MRHVCCSLFFVDVIIHIYPIIIIISSSSSSHSSTIIIIIITIIIIIILIILTNINIILSHVLTFLVFRHLQLILHPNKHHQSLRSKHIIAFIWGMVGLISIDFYRYQPLSRVKYVLLVLRLNQKHYCSLTVWSVTYILREELTDFDSYYLSFRDL